MFKTDYYYHRYITISRKFGGVGREGNEITRNRVEKVRERRRLSGEENGRKGKDRGRKKRK